MARAFDRNLGMDAIPRAIFTGVCALGVAVALLSSLIEPRFFAFYGDANSRLVGARLITDSISPGLHWLGTVWLPLPALLFAPFARVDFLFASGLAGAVVCLPLLAWSAVMLYRLAAELTASPGAGLFAAVFYALNPNMLYISMTAMTETIALFFMIAAVYNAWAHMRDLRPQRGVRRLALAALSTAAATLCRYEAWPFACIVFLALVWDAVRRRMGAKDTVRSAALAVACFLGIALWLVWNHTRFGDALAFHRAEYYSAAWQAKHRPVRGQYYLQAWNVLSIYVATLFAAVGVAPLLVSVFGALRLARCRPRAATVFLFSAFLTPPAFTILSLYLGVAEMTRWWNSRYVLLLMPLLALSAAFAAEAAGKRITQPLLRVILILLLLASAVVQFARQAGNVVTVADAAGGFYYRQTPYAVAVGEFLGAHDKGGRILAVTGTGQSHRIMQTSGIRLARFTTALNRDTLFRNPEVLSRAFTWVIVGREASPDGAEIARYWIEHDSTLATYYRRAYSNAFYIVYERLQR
ncbi:MAG: glycosyltransferase family 39 protein [Bacteroidota bacterium]|nr:glycosyltransferase family 39 protein [Bacteroidota bacterium]